ncbi:MAG: acyl-CoA synthetase [Rhodospirillales bacterium 69-11]|nr:MAG: acyl-CoA synthetase [Rhodospirillales bacterium 69-11]
MALIRDLARVCKSKNAGPFELTIDVVFEDAETFRRVKATGVLTAALFARLYQVPEEHVLFTPYDAAFAFKATLPRLVPAGDFGDTDVYGCQQHAPLLDVDIPL